MKRDFLESLGLTKETVDKILDENSRDIGREKQKADQAKEDLSTVRQQLADREKDIEALQKSNGDVTEMQKQLNELQAKYDKDTGDYKTQLSDRDYADAMRKAVSEKGIRFSSKAAEKAYYADLKAKQLELKDGALVGFEDWHKSQAEADPSAFQSGKPTPRITSPTGRGGEPNNEGLGAKYAKQFNAQYAQTNTKE